MKHPKRSQDTRKRVLIVDDHPLLREGIVAVINQQEDLVVCGESFDASDAMAAIAACNPDVVITDLCLHSSSGLDLIMRIHRQHPEVPVLVLTVHSEDQYAEAALRAGARGYVMKSEAVDVVVAAVRKVLRGQTAVSPRILERLLFSGFRRERQAVRPVTDLFSVREEQIYRFLGSGLGTVDIAKKLGISVSTVESHRAGIKRKLNIRNAAELVSGAARFVASESAVDETEDCLMFSATPEKRLPRY